MERLTFQATSIGFFVLKLVATMDVTSGFSILLKRQCDGLVTALQKYATSQYCEKLSVLVVLSLVAVEASGILFHPGADCPRVQEESET